MSSAVHAYVSRSVVIFRHSLQYVSAQHHLHVALTSLFPPCLMKRQLSILKKEFCKPPTIHTPNPPSSTSRSKIIPSSHPENIPFPSVPPPKIAAVLQASPAASSTSAPITVDRPHSTFCLAWPSETPESLHPSCRNSRVVFPVATHSGHCRLVTGLEVPAENSSDGPRRRFRGVAIAASTA